LNNSPTFPLFFVRNQDEERKNKKGHWVVYPENNNRNLPSTRGALYVDRDLYQSISKALW